MKHPAFRYVFYRIADAQGRSRTGLARLPVTDFVAAHQLLERRMQATVLSVHVLSPWLLPLLDFLALFLRQRIPLTLLAEFLYSLGLMLRSGLPVDVALRDLSSDAAQRGLRHLADDLLEGVRSGNSLSSRLAFHEQQVPATVRHLIEIGERSGNLDRVLMDAASHLERIITLRQDMSRALIYPLFVVVTILGAGGFWVYYVLPDLADMFRQMGASLPPLTRGVMSAIHSGRSLLETHGTWLLWGILLLAAVLPRSLAVRRGLYWLAFRLPVSRTLVRTSAMAFISEYLAMLVAAGINLLDCLTILETATRNDVYRQAIRQAREGVQRGNSLSGELGRSKAFPPLMIRLINVGEQSGNLDGQLRILADEYRRRLNHVVATLSEVIKPVVLLLAGGLFIFVVVVFLLPVYDLIAQSTQLR